ncbi:Ig-like domain-containing protein [Stenotrophomonas sp. MH1]|uniref:Ig-like domain-containing protein n=1 Tax=Stenotrophomonas capsici TaxID=3110230 RepID=A0ABU5V0D4_9GAMM|nr:Ig-like domain-containing protein [Stenotrophomonas sp. MH1]MEA5666804.1 Ig-like domain-containing protein [Stenotrophomonas sp. MH1]
MNLIVSTVGRALAGKGRLLPFGAADDAVQAESLHRYLVADAAGSAAPEQITVVRSGMDLNVIDASATSATAVVIENFFGSEAQLLGHGTEGTYRAYGTAAEALRLADGESTTLHLTDTVAVAQVRTSGAPSIDIVWDDQGGVQGEVANGGFTDDGRPLMSGTAPEGVLVHIYDGALLVGRVTADAGGNWWYTPRIPLADGRHEITILHEYEDGEVSDFSEPYVITVDKLIPDVPVIDAVMDDEGRLVGTIAFDGITDDSRPTIQGTAEPHASVIVYDRGREIGRALVDAQGKWSFTPDSALKEGLHIFDYATVDRAGNQSERIGAFEFNVDTRPELVNIHGAEDGVGAVTGTVGTGGTTDDTLPTLQGSATAGGIVRIYDGATLLGQTTAGFDGRWSFTPGTALAAGLHALQATVTLPAKGESARSPVFQLTIEVEVPNSAQITEVIDGHGSVQGVLGQGDATDDAAPTLRGSAQANATVRLYSNGVLLGSAVADGGGQWTFKVTGALAQGENALVVTTVGAGGGESAPTAPYVVWVDSVAPDKPAITSVLDDVGSEVGEIQNGGVSDDRQPQVKGSAEAGSTVVLFDAGVEIGRTTADVNGHWSITPATPLSKGTHTLTVQAIDAIGNGSTLSDAFGFVTEVNGNDHPAALELKKPVVELRLLLDSSSQTAVNFAATKQAAIDALSAYVERGVEVSVDLYSNGLVHTQKISSQGDLARYSTKVNELAIQSGYNFDSDLDAAIHKPWGGSPASILYIGDGVNATVSGIGNYRSLRLLVDEGIHHPFPATLDMSFIAIPKLPTGTYLTTMQSMVTTPILVSPAPAELGQIIPKKLVVDTAVGNVVDNDLDVSRNGSEHLTQVRCGAEVFRITGANKLVIDNATGAVKASYDAASGLLKLETDGSTLWMWMKNAGDSKAGNYRYDVLFAAGQGAGGLSQSFEYVVTNNLGQTQTSTIFFEAVAKNTSYAADALLQTGSGEFLDATAAISGNAGAAEGAPHDAVVRAEPRIDTVLDKHGPIQGAVVHEGYTDDGRARISGKADAGTTVHIYDGVLLIGRVTADINGNWSFVPRVPMADGRHELSIVHESPAGDISEFSDTYVVHVDKVTPDIPTVHGMVDDQGRIIGAISHGSVTDDNLPTITGTGEPNAFVIVYDKGVEIGRAPVDAQGKWSFTPGVALADGLHILEYAAVDRTGNQSEKTAALEFLVDTRPERVDILLADDDVGAITGVIVSGGITDDGTPTLRGSATAGGIVKIYEGSVLLGKAVADVDGTWQFTPSTPLSEGPHTLHATVTLVAKGESERSKPFTLTVDAVAPVQPVIDGAYDNVGAVQGLIGNGMSTDDRTPTLTGKAEANSLVQVYIDGAQVGSVMADSAGNWSFTPGVPLVDGSHQFTVTSQDAAGNPSVSSQPFTVVVDTVLPSKPSIDQVLDDQGAVTGALNSGDYTDDAKPTLVGTTEPYATVVVKDNGLTLGTAQANADGKWTFEPGMPLGKGEHSFTVVVVDAAGNSSVTSDRFDLIVVDDEVPAAPAITRVVDDVGSITGELGRHAVTDDTRPTISGTSQAGMTVSLYSNGTLLGQVQANANGEWSFTPGADLADGLHTITAIATNLAGNASAPAAAYPITVDTTLPARPGAGEAELFDDEGPIRGVITDGSTTDDSTPTFSGTSSEANGTVIVYDNGQVIGQARIDELGNWSFTPKVPLEDGDHALSYAVKDEAGNLGERSEAIAFVVDTRGAEIHIDGATDNAGRITGALSAGGVTDDATPILHGRAAAGGIVKIYDGGVLVGQTTANAAGTWSLELPVALASGTHDLTATVTIDSKGEGDHTAPFTLIVDLEAPNKPSIGAIEDNVGSVQGAIGPGQATDDTTPTLKGTAEAGSTVHVYDNGTLSGSVVAGADGSWSYTPAVVLGDGSHSFTVTSEDKAGNVSVPSDVQVVIVDTAAPGKPVIGGVHDNQGGSTGNLVSGAETDDATPTLSGAAEPNSTIVIKDNGQEIGRVQVDGNGNWSFEPDQPLDDGEHALSVVNVDAAGNQSLPSDPFVLTIDASGGGKPVITAVADDQGPRQGLLAAGESTDDVNPSLSGTAKPGSTLTVWDNGVKIGQALADASGNWNFTPTVALQQGAHSIHVTAVDALGSEGEPSEAFAFTVDTAVPETPKISNLRDDVGGYQGIQRSGGHTDDTRPMATGTGKPGDLIELRVDGVAVGTAVVGADGRWNVPPSTDLAEGLHTFTAVAISPSGVESAASAGYLITVDTLPPESPVVVSVVDNAGSWTGELHNGDFTDDRTPTFKGKADPSSTLLVFINGEEIGFAEWMPTVTGPTPPSH